MPSYGGTSAITSYTVTPIVGGRTSSPITVGGNGNGANIPNLPGGGSYAFQVQANNASGAGIVVVSSAVTIGSPTPAPGGFDKYLFMRGGPNDVAAWAHYGLVSRNNASALSRVFFRRKDKGSPASTANRSSPSCCFSEALIAPSTCRRTSAGNALSAHQCGVRRCFSSLTWRNRPSVASRSPSRSRR